MAQRREQKAHRALLSLVPLHLHVGQAAIGVYRSVDHFVACPGRSPASVPGYPGPWPCKPGELFGVQVQEDPRRLDLEAFRRRLGF